MIRILTLAGGLAGAAALSQYPEFSQQYLQRLGGTIEGLGEVVADFDADAARSDLTREEALAQMTGTAFVEDRAASMAATIARFERLTRNHQMLTLATPLERLAMPHRLGDREVLAGTWGDFKPAVPLTVAGAVSAGVGFVGGMGLVGGLLALLALPFRRRRAPAPDPVPALAEVREGRAEPPLSGPRPRPGGRREPTIPTTCPHGAPGTAYCPTRRGSRSIPGCRD